MNTRRSLLLSAAFILVFLRITIADVPKDYFAETILSCNERRNFSMEISNHERAHLYQAELFVRINRNTLSVIGYPGMNAVNVRGNNVEVNFRGYLVIEDVDQKVLTQPERISQIYVDRISGIAQQTVQNSTDSMVHDCRLVLLPTEAERPNVHVRIANEIRRIAESCVELALCERIIHMKPQEVIQSPSQSGSGLLSVYADPIVLTAPPARNNEPENSGIKFSHGSVQSAMNKLVDIALAEIIEKLREKNEGTVNVSNIDKNFSTGSGIFETTGHFEAVDGTLRDLTTIHRTTDATLSHVGMKFAASCGFGLQILNLNYDRYRLKYGIIKVNGKLAADIDGMAFEATVAADYAQTPCVMELEQLKVTEFGKMKIRITGLSPLNSMVSTLLGWVSQKWDEEIVSMIEKKMRKKVQARLATLNCERFRP